jgi:hypothetical protein
MVEGLLLDSLIPDPPNNSELRSVTLSDRATPKSNEESNLIICNKNITASTYKHFKSGNSWLLTYHGGKKI